DTHLTVQVRLRSAEQNLLSLELDFAGLESDGHGRRLATHGERDAVGPGVLRWRSRLAGGRREGEAFARSNEVVRAALPAAHTIHSIFLFEAPSGDRRDFSAGYFNFTTPVSGFLVLQSEGDAENVPRRFCSLLRGSHGDHQDDGGKDGSVTSDTLGHRRL